MPAALKRPTLDELYKRLRDVDYTQVDEGLAVKLDAILQLEAQGERRESATEAVLMMEGGWRPESSSREYRSGEFPFPTRPSAGAGTQSASKPPSMFRSQQTEESYPDLGSMRRELERAQRERDKAILDRDQAALERDQARLDREQATLERDKAILDRDLLMTARVQEQRLQESVANFDQLTRTRAAASGRKWEGEKEDYD